MCFLLRDDSTNCLTLASCVLRRQSCKSTKTSQNSSRLIFFIQQTPSSAPSFSYHRPIDLGPARELAKSCARILRALRRAYDSTTCCINHLCLVTSTASIELGGICYRQQDSEASRLSTSWTTPAARLPNTGQPCQLLQFTCVAKFFGRLQ